MSVINRNQRLNGLNPLAYIGDNAYQPPEFVTDNRPPTPNDAQNFELGTIWLDRASNLPNPPKAENVWILVSLSGGSATWINFADGNALKTLTGNSGGAVSADAAQNINIVGDGTTITIAGNPATHTLTVSVVGSGVLSTLTGDSGGAVSPLAGNINTLGTAGKISVTGNPATHTLTWNLDGSVGQSFPTDSGTATPAAGVLNIKTQNATLGAGSSVLFSAPGPSNTVQLNVTDANSNTIIGNNAGNLTLTGTNNTTLGKSTGHALTSANANTIIGSLSGALITTGSNHTIVGESAATALTTGTFNLVIGQGAGSALTIENNNVLMNHPGSAGVSGLLALGMKFRNANSVFMHNYPGDNSLNGSSFYVGNNCGNFSSTAIGNMVLGSDTLSNITTGPHNIAVGLSTLNALTTGDGNIALGHSAGFNIAGVTGLVSGNYNVLIGYTAGTNYTTSESSNIIIANDGVVGESNTLRIGVSTGTGNRQLNRTFIQGIRGITTTNNDAVAVLVDSAGQLGTVSSSIRYKENVKDMGTYSKGIYKLKPVTFNYKQRHPESISVGLIAEDVVEHMPDLVVTDCCGCPETVKYHDLPVLLLNELQKLAKRVEELEKRIS